MGVYEDTEAEVKRLIREHEIAVSEENRITVKYTVKMPKPCLSLPTEEACREMFEARDTRLRLEWELANAQKKLRDL